MRQVISGPTLSLVLRSTAGIAPSPPVHHLLFCSPLSPWCRGVLSSDELVDGPAAWSVCSLVASCASPSTFIYPAKCEVERVRLGGTEAQLQAARRRRFFLRLTLLPPPPSDRPNCLALDLHITLTAASAPVPTPTTISPAAAAATTTLQQPFLQL